MDNGAALLTDFDVCKIEKQDSEFTLTASNGNSVKSKLVINCAGLGSGKIASLVGDDQIVIGARKGEYVLLDRESGDFVKHTLFCTPTEKGKGILVTPTVDKNVLLGPTSEEQENGCTDTSANGLAFVTEKAKSMTQSLPLYNTITSFAGVRAYSSRHDFIVEESKSMPGFIHCCGIESPGLTSAPAIGKYVVEEIVCKLLNPKKNEKFCGIRKADYFFKDLSVAKKNEIIRQNPAYGKMICRCEQITEGEIVRAIHENPPARNIDAVKRRTRAGMGRCQGGFCQPQVAEILARELHCPLEEITKNGKGSEIVVGESK